MYPVNETLLDSYLAQLEGAKNWSPRIISKLESFIRSADDYDLFRLNALAYATERSMSESETIDLFLHASKIGLFDLEWNLICSCCGQVFSSLRNMNKLHSHFVCMLCGMENEARLDDYIEVSFSVSAAVRDTIFRHPESLSPVDYAVKYSMTKGIMREPSLGSNLDFMSGFTEILEYLEPGQSVHREMTLTPGPVFGGDLIHNNIVILEAHPPEVPDAVPIHLSFGLPTMKVNEPHTNSVVVEMPTGHGTATYRFQHFAQIPSGRSRWIFENKLQEKVLVWVVNVPHDFMSTYVSFPAFLTGRRVLTSQTFRDLYQSEVIDQNQSLGIRDITFLFTDLKGSTALYDRLGDLKAYHLVRQHFDALSAVITKHAGAIVKTIGDAVMASFSSPTDGLCAALEMLKAIKEFNEGRPETIILKIGVHTGHSIAVTLNERLDYFGQTVNIAARVQQLAEANEIYISQDVFEADNVSEVLKTCEVTPSQVNVKGVSGTLQVYRVVHG